MNGYGVRGGGGGNPGLSNGDLNGGLNGGGVGSLDNGLTAADEHNAITAYYDEEDGNDVGVTSPLLGNGTVMAMAGNGSAVGAGAMEPEMMQGGNSIQTIWDFGHFLLAIFLN